MAQAFAAYDCKCGTYSELVLAQFSGKDDNNIVDKASISSGSCPGMSLKLSADATQILLSGTPTKPGTYKLTVAFEMRDGQPGSTDATVNVARGTADRAGFGQHDRAQEGRQLPAEAQPYRAARPMRSRSIPTPATALPAARQEPPGPLNPTART